MNKKLNIYKFTFLISSFWFTIFQETQIKIKKK